jgi:hypothetical protein
MTQTTKAIQFKASIEMHREYKLALADLGMTSAEFFVFMIKNYKQLQQLKRN